jgi:hypothetical protein
MVQDGFKLLAETPFLLVGQFQARQVRDVFDFLWGQ